MRTIFILSLIGHLTRTIAVTSYIYPISNCTYDLFNHTKMTRGCLILCCYAGILFASFSPVKGLIKPPKKYVVNLDVEPEKRWQEVALDHTFLIKDIQSIVTSVIPKDILPYIELIATDIDYYLPKPYAGEMRGFAKVLNISVGDIVMTNLIYDVSAFCTSIISQDDKGQIWHSRNLDYPFTGILENITIAVDFQSRGQTVYSVVTYAGYIGALTGQRPNVFTITVDERDQGSIIWNLVIGILDKNVVPVSFLVRDALANDTTFEAAINRLSFTPTAADAYFIMGGVKPGEGAVITKGRLAPDDVWRLDPANGRWFLVETNYDHWTPPPPNDNRRDPAIKAISSLGQANITVMNLFNVMSTPKVLNS
ncbi:N-acylethanolamine-hydrolyzing acid amidase-like [Ruditapes philippinarum]|uniref:N-acylethanolamine-hydrolyzing acid amidase-like n=1 Tax=Ruditapes philippinarum TaxID=129788 RepID=UPI00295C288E|nr:N-acylethanolamine-hydrolyzing acid amidase-like [Ruditapes philippinarum]